MVNLRCDDYGFDCDYVIEDTIEKVIFGYWEHMNNEHGIDYSKGSIWESVKRKESATSQKLLENIIDV